mgnify:CR=1 FL=1
MTLLMLSYLFPHYQFLSLVVFTDCTIKARIVWRTLYDSSVLIPCTVVQFLVFILIIHIVHLRFCFGSSSVSFVLYIKLLSVLFLLSKYLVTSHV